MCGIAGIAGAGNFPGDQLAVWAENACSTLYRRGPDFRSWRLKDDVLLCHARLSIIDTSDAANQPMFDESGRFAILLNGEIFNFREIKSGLISAGCVFRTVSDTEVALKALIHYGPEAFNLFNGFFAIAFYDFEKRKLVLGRDRYGEKPLLYCMQDEALFFASEIKALSAMGRHFTEDLVSEAFYFFLTYIPGEDTAYREVKKLPPGHYLEFDDGRMTIRKYYDYPAEQLGISYEAACERFSELLDDAVRLRLVADVPLGSFLSAGIDSTLVSLLAAKHQPGIATFSVGFPDMPFFDESEPASETARNAGLPNTTISIAENELIRSLEAVLDYLDEPFADSSAIAVYALTKAASAYGKVFLSGDGADELLGGYNKHKAWAMLENRSLRTSLMLKAGSMLPVGIGGRDSKMANKLRQLRRLASAAGRKDFERYFYLASNNPMELSSRLINRQIIESDEFVARMDGFRQKFLTNNTCSVLQNDFQIVLEGDMLRKTDLMSMANSVELRSPFLDYRLVDFIFSLPDKYKFSAAKTKMPARDAFKSILPEAVLRKKKQGFEVPLKKWFSGVLRERMRDEWLEEKNLQSPLFDSRNQARMIEDAVMNRLPESFIWSLIVFANRKQF